MPFLSTKSGKIFYTVQGKADAETLLLLRGYARSSRYWLGFDHVMAQNYRVICIDQRGTGRTTVPMNWTDGPDELAEDCLKVLDQLKIDRCHVLGHSFGGLVGMSLAAEAPERIRSLAVAACSTADSPLHRIQPLALARLVYAVQRGRFQDELLSLSVSDPVLRSWGQEIQASWEEILKDEGFPLVTLVKQLRAAAAYRIGKRLHHGHYPILVLHGSLDKLHPLMASLRLNQILPRARIKLLKGGAHELALGQESELHRILRSFTETAP